MTLYEMVVMGGSAGGMEALEMILRLLPADFPAPVAVVMHLSPDSDNYLVDYLNRNCRLRVKEPEDREILQPGRVFMAPPNYHLLLERDRRLVLSAEPKIHYSRPSIDPLFETAADAFGPRLVGVLLSGANRDGSAGLKKIKDNGGLAIVQSPESTRISHMVRAAMEAVPVDHVLPPQAIGNLLKTLFGKT